MRTTVTLDPDTEQMLRRRMKERRVSFKQALNDAVRAGLAPPDESEFRTGTASMGRSAVNLDKALQLVGELEDEELVRKMRTGS
jgi:uracil-DNA glycosylase